MVLTSHIRERVLTAFSDLEFDEEKHLYKLRGRGMPSVSKLVESHAVKVDFNAILPFSAAKQSRETGIEISPESLKAQWAKKNKDACDRGHRTHDFMEHFSGIEKPRNGWEEAGAKFFLEMSEQYDVVFREIRMYSEKYWYAGTEDLVLIDRSTGELITADYKTNEDLWKNYKGKTLKEPFDYLMECPYNKYQIQLSYYQIMLEEVSLAVKGRWLVYLQEDGNYKTFKLNDLTGELRHHLESKAA